MSKHKHNQRAKKMRTLKIGKRKVVYRKAYQAGFNRGYNEAYGTGVTEGMAAFHHVIDMTSIIIPTHNARALLEQCVDSIRKYTPEPHEIIVIDNGSTDGTADYLRTQAGRLRYHIEPEPLGFARAVNLGLRMSRGANVMFLNNDTVVTSRWLSNLLACLHADPERRVVGPVTNYISGEQRIETNYTSLPSMHRFALLHNVSDPSRWQETNRLTGFCVLMKRQTMLRIGYLDEGFEVGNCEDDDYGFRARLAGMQLWIARDAFIHHVGSASMNKLGEEGVREVTQRNVAYLTNKWGDIHALIDRTKQMNAANEVLASSRFFPTHVYVRVAGERVFWLEGGVRYAVHIPAQSSMPYLSLIALRHFPHGGEISQEEATAKLTMIHSGASDQHHLIAGSLYRDPAGTIYQYDGHALRDVVTPTVLQRWCMQDRPVLPISFDLCAQIPQGLPIIAPEILLNEL